jgi:hypothetical protein
MHITVYEDAQRFTFEDPTSDNLCQVLGYAYDLASHARQAVYLLAFEVDARGLGDLSTAGGRGNLVVRLGPEDAGAKRFEYGRDVVLWKPGSRQWAYDVMSTHWQDRHLWWGLLTDQRDTREVAQSIAEAWPDGYSTRSLQDLLHTVSPERVLVLLACEGSFIDGRTQPECWDTARLLLARITGVDLDVIDGTSNPKGG